MENKNFGKGFKTGWFALNKEQKDFVMKRVKELLHLKESNQNTFYEYMRGDKEMLASQAVEVDKMFKAIGINNCWNL